MSEVFEVQNMDKSHIPTFGSMLFEMVSESPENYSITSEFAKDYGSSDKFLEGMAKAIQENKVGRFVVEDKHAGCIAAVTSSMKDDSVRIGNMYVIPSYRGRGIGRLLLEACEGRAIADNIGTTSLVVGSNNSIARKFYLSEGYRPKSPPELEAWSLHPGVNGETLIKNLAN